MLRCAVQGVYMANAVDDAALGPDSRGKVTSFLKTKVRPAHVLLGFI